MCETNHVLDNHKFKICSIGKGCLPYERICDISYLYEFTELPPKEHFYSTLSEQNISDEDYSNALQFWDIYETQHLAEYTARYCLLDTLLLAEVFNKFRNEIWDWLNLEPCRYLGLPSLSLDIFLKHTRAKIGLISDPEQFDLIERGLRGGLSYCANRYLTAFQKGELLNYWDMNK